MVKKLLQCPKCGQLGHVRNIGCCGVKWYMCFPCGYEAYPKEFPLIEVPEKNK